MIEPGRWPPRTAAVAAMAPGLATSISRVAVTKPSSFSLRTLASPARSRGGWCLMCNGLRR